MRVFLIVGAFRRKHDEIKGKVLRWPRACRSVMGPGGPGAGLTGW